jgi:hypothetical protein
MIKIEVTGNSLGELADKLIALGNSLRDSDNDRIASKAWAEERKQAKDEAAYAPPAEPAAPVTDAPALSFEKDVAPIVLRAVATKGKPFVEGIMTQFGVERASQLPAERWPELITHLEEAPF